MQRDVQRDVHHAVVDDYFDAVQAFDSYFDGVADRTFGDHPLDPAKQRRWFEMRRALVRFHRLVVTAAVLCVLFRRRDWL